MTCGFGFKILGFKTACSTSAWRIFTQLVDLALSCRIQNNMFDESLFSLIPLSFFVHLEGCLVLNSLLLVHFLQLGFIVPLFQVLIGLNFFSNYF